MKNYRLTIFIFIVCLAITAFGASKNHTGIISNSALIYPGAYAADVTGDATDVSDHRGAMITALVASGTYSEANSVKFKLEHSDSTSTATFEAVAAGDVIGVTPDSAGSFLVLEAATAGDKIQSLAYIGNKNYIRVLLDASGTVTATASVVLTKSMPYIAQ